MGYDVALKKAWSDLEKVMRDERKSIRLLADEYVVDTEKKSVLSLACNLPAKDHLSILIVHYLIQKLKGIPSITGEWISFKQLDGGEGYFPAFKKRAIDPILRKYGSKPETLLETMERFKAKRVRLADINIVLEVLDGVPVLITLQRADEEFSPEANILFDKSIKDIFCTEDAVVLAEFVASVI